ncbi:MAG: hypothetical protein U9R32_03070 [Bacteroidota bacterium]|nr:hypothetical protein [Bacteroidota bacterium]
MLNRNLNALVSGQTNYKRMKRPCQTIFNTHENDYKCAAPSDKEKLN